MKKARKEEYESHIDPWFIDTIRSLTAFRAVQKETEIRFKLTWNFFYYYWSVQNKRELMLQVIIISFDPTWNTVALESLHLQKWTEETFV